LDASDRGDSHGENGHPPEINETIHLQNGDQEVTDNEQANCGLVRRAFEFAYALHQGQKGASGEAYICHPIEVAGLLRELGGDSAMIAAGFLHDVVEDTEVTPEEIEAHFGEEVRHLV
jgi:GTP pyrophosphokinase